MGITIRNLSSADINAANDILVAAFASPRTFHQDLNRYLAFQRDGWFLAIMDGRPVGMAGAINYGSFAYVGMVGVVPDAQRQGIGVALMNHLLAWLDERKCPIAVLDASEAGAPMYTHLGFIETDQTLVLLRDTATTIASPNERVRRMRESDLPGVAAFDAPIFGVQRGAILRACFAEYSDRAFVAHDDAGQVAGYLIAQEQTLGPWIARDVTYAEALLVAAQSMTYPEGMRALVPVQNQAAMNLLTRCGFTVSRTQHHMQRGEGTVPGNRSMLYGQISLAIG